MLQVQTAMFAALTALGVWFINWIINIQFVTGFISGWHISKWFN